MSFWLKVLNTFFLHQKSIIIDYDRWLAKVIFQTRKTSHKTGEYHLSATHQVPLSVWFQITKRNPPASRALTPTARNQAPSTTVRFARRNRDGNFSTRSRVEPRRQALRRKRRMMKWKQSRGASVLNCERTRLQVGSLYRGKRSSWIIYSLAVWFSRPFVT